MKVPSEDLGGRDRGTKDFGKQIWASSWRRYFGRTRGLTQETGGGGKTDPERNRV